MQKTSFEFWQNSGQPEVPGGCRQFFAARDGKIVNQG
jgi:hypothetical protein